jgi:hypothetical protein
MLRQLSKRSIMKTGFWLLFFFSQVSFSTNTQCANQILANYSLITCPADVLFWNLLDHTILPLCFLTSTTLKIVPCKCLDVANRWDLLLPDNPLV